MARMFAIAAENAKVPVAETGMKNAEMGVTHLAVINAVKGLAREAGVAAWKFLATRTALGERTAKHRIEGTRRLSADEISALLCTDDGYRYLAAIATAWVKKPLWYSVCEPLMELADIQRMQLAARRKYEAALKGTIDANQTLSAAIARGQDALMVQDPEFYGTHVAAARELAGRPATGPRPANRALASKGRGR